MLCQTLLEEGGGGDGGRGMAHTTYSQLRRDGGVVKGVGDFGLTAKERLLPLLSLN